MLASLLAALLGAAAPVPAAAHHDDAAMKHEMPCCEQDAKKDCCKGEAKMDCCEKMKAEPSVPAEGAGHAH